MPPALRSNHETPIPLFKKKRLLAAMLKTHLDWKLFLDDKSASKLFGC